MTQRESPESQPTRGPNKTRRAFLTAAGLGAIAWASELKVRDLLTADTPADSFLKSFPDSIPGASRVNKRYTPGAQFCLIHIEQDHEVLETEEEKKRVEKAHDDIEIILDALMKNPDVQLEKCYLENYGSQKSIQDKLHPEVSEFPSRAEVKNNIIKQKKGIEQQKEAIEKRHPGDKDFLLGLHSLEASLRYWEAMDTDDYNPVKEQEKNKRRTQQKATRTNAAFRIHHKTNGNLQVLPAETNESRMLPFTENAVEWKNGEYHEKVENSEAVFWKREAVTLNILQKTGDLFDVVLYGNAHAFDMNRWNKEHPDWKISVIEIRPNAL